MRLLLDACVWGGALSVLVAAGHEVEWVGSWSADPGDEEVLAAANASGQVVVTLDRDFGELAVVHQRPHAGILRLVGFSAPSQAAACLQALDRYGAELSAGGLVTAEPGRFRVRPADRPG